MDNTEDFGTLTFVLTGYTTLTGGSEGIRTVELLDDRLGALAVGTQRFFDRKKWSQFRVGDVVSVPKANAEGTSIYTGSAKWLRRWEDQDKLLEWQAQARAYDVTHRQEVLMKKEQTRNLIREVMGPLHTMYANTNYENQMALTALVLDALQRGKGVR